MSVGSALISGGVDIFYNYKNYRMSMKCRIISILVYLFCFSWTFPSHSQNLNDIPVNNGKVVFSDTIATTKNTDNLTNEFVSWMNNTFLKEKGYVTSIDSVNNLVVCRATEYLEMEKSNWSVFALYLKYTLIIKYSEGKCILEVRNIGYIEPENVEGNNKKLPVFSAEYVFVDKKYKSIFIKDAINKIANKTIVRINEIFSSIRYEITQSQ